MTPTVSWSEAFLAMLAMMTVLTFVLIYYCCIPCYRGMKRRKQREEEYWETDPRWDRENFSFVPRKPNDFMNDKKYSRLAACSRTSSMRSTNTTGQFLADIEPPKVTTEVVTTAALVAGPAKKPNKPPKYSELYETGSTSGGSMGTPPRYTSKTPSTETSQENVTKPKVIKPKKKQSALVQPSKASNETTVKEVTQPIKQQEKKPE